MPNGFEPETIARERERRRKEGRGWGPAPAPPPPPPPPPPEREYPHLPGFGWEWPGPVVDWERYAKVPMQVMMGERPWEALEAPKPEELLLPEAVTLPPKRPPARTWGMAGWEGVTPIGPRAYPTGVEMALAGNIGRWGQEYSAQTPLDFPEGYLVPPSLEGLEDKEAAMAAGDYEQRVAAVRSRAYDIAIFDPETGRQLSWREVERLARTNPFMTIVEVLALGGGRVEEGEGTISELLEAYTLEGLRALVEEEALGIKTRVEEQLEQQFIDKETKVLDPGIADLVSKLDAKVSPAELQDAKMQLKIELYNLYLENPEFAYEEDIPGRGENPWNKAERKINEALQAQGKFQGYAAEAGKLEPPEAMPPPPGRKAPARYAPVAEKVDVGTLRETLAPYGISVLGTWPYLELTEEQLRQLPSDVFEMMGKYLRERGVALGDAIVRPETRGAPPMRGRWEIPRQW